MIIDLAGTWELTFQDKKIKAKVPGTLLSTLISERIIPNPYFGLNEASTLPYLEGDATFTRNFFLNPRSLLKENYLIFEGIDTYSDVYINGVKSLTTDDMHLTYKLSLPQTLVKKGVNELKVVIHSAYQYLNEHFNKNELFCGFQEATYRFPKIRKAHSSFGWDWGPTLPDQGIFRNVYLVSTSIGSIDEMRYSVSYPSSGIALLSVKIKGRVGRAANLSLSITDPYGALVIKKSAPYSGNNELILQINAPKKWFPIGYGEQPLYTLNVHLEGEDDVFDKVYRIGLREVKVIDTPDAIGRPLTVLVNGIPIFMKGADYIPLDAIYSHIDRDKTAKLLNMVKDYNHNCIRVWGGGFYPDDYFYDLCDEMGILVFEDLMFACATYDSNDAHFMDLIEKETRENLRRIRHHASLVLISGNNECEEAITSWNPPRVEEQKTSYRKIFIDLLGGIVKEETDLYYLSSSPTSGEPLFINTQDDNFLDRHCWDVWHGMLPVSHYRDIYPRFLSEFGLQSYPSLTCIKSYAKSEELDENSAVMLSHQKNKSGNAKIHHYISESYKEPKDFPSLVYLSQLSQAEAVRTCVEHLRINKGRCMGAIYWQLNDCWGVQSWSSIDYSNVPKILHYQSRKFFRDALIAFEPHDGKINLYVLSDRLSPSVAKVKVTLNDLSGKIIKQENYMTNLNFDHAVRVASLDDHQGEYGLFYKAVLQESDHPAYQTYYFFVKPKEIALSDPKLVIEQASPKVIKVTASEFAYAVYLQSPDPDLTFSDNGFNLEKDESRRIYLSNEKKVEDIQVTSLYEASK